MRKLSLILCLWLATATLAVAQEAKTPYAGQEEHAIKALSLEEIRQYLTGAGMGFARAAELNHFPGPKHVLELAGQLALTKEQTARTEEIRQVMHTEAVRRGKALVEKEVELDRLFAGTKIKESQLNELVGDIARLQGRVRATHLKAHLEMKRLLTPHQVRLYDQLRGYGAGHTYKQH